MLKKIFLLITVSLVFAAAVCAQGSSTSTTTSKTATTSKPKRPPIFRPNKDQIKQVQAILKEKKFYDGDATGVYNEGTRGGIKTFQKGNGLKETGTLNRATLEKFGVELTDKQKLIPVSQSSFATASTGTSTKKPSKTTTSTTGDTPKKAPIFRATVDQIKAAQKLLKDKSFYSGEATGKLDDATRDGLKKYQGGNNVKVTGTLNAITLDKMGIALTDKQKADAAATASTTTP